MTMLSLIDGSATMDWRDEAQCLRVDPNLMQPERATEAEVRVAKAVCAGCPVLERCRAEALEQTPAYGVWAGEWHGEAPVWQIDKRCAQCAGLFRVDRDTKAGQRATYCSESCRVEARRVRDAERRERQQQEALEAKAAERQAAKVRTTCPQCRGTKAPRKGYCSALCRQSASRNRARAGRLPA